MKTRIFLIAATIGIALLMYANSTSSTEKGKTSRNECADLLLELFQKYAHLQDSIGKGKMVHLACQYSGGTYRINGSDTSLIPFKQDYEIFLGEEFKKIISTDFEFYDDSKESFYLVKQAKELYNTVTTKRYDSMGMNKMLFDMNDSSLNKIKILYCKKIKDSTNTEATLEQPEGFYYSQVTDMEIKIAIPSYIKDIDSTLNTEVTYFLNSKKLTVSAINVHYPTADFGLNDMTLRYQNIQIIPDTLTIKNLSSKFLTKHGELLPKYNDYEYINLKNKNLSQRIQEFEEIEKRN